MKLSGLEAGLLINFNSVPLKSGIRRFNRPAADFSSVSSVSQILTIADASNLAEKD